MYFNVIHLLLQVHTHLFVHIGGTVTYSDPQLEVCLPACSRQKKKKKTCAIFLVFKLF